LKRLALFALLTACGAHTETPTRPGWTMLESATTESLRGLVVVSDAVVWASGAHGTIVQSIDGTTFTRCATPPSGDALDFRSLVALDALRAMVLSAGSPARLFVTADGCARWTEAYAREGEGVFFDSLVVRDGDGVALGDPLPSADGPRFAMLVSHGAAWVEREGPIAGEGEAAFAASNGCIAWPADDALFFATSASRVLRSTDRGASWTSTSVPIASSESAGVFAIAFRDAHIGYAIGGDYAAPARAGSFARTRDGVSWELGTSPRGYRSSIAITHDGLIAVGTSGSDVSYDDGASWIAIDDVPLNAVRAIDDVVYAVGPGGVIARLSGSTRR
jgi:photosystem II stability/assembly factor-like uncharacterized protein